jgi:hypothetical protein
MVGVPVNIRIWYFLNSSQQKYTNLTLHLAINTKLVNWKLNSIAWVRERTIPSERSPLVSEVSANNVVSLTDPYGCIRGFLDRSRYFFFQVAPQLYSRGWVDLVPNPLLLRISGSAGNRTRNLWICSQEYMQNIIHIGVTWCVATASLRKLSKVTGQGGHLSHLRSRVTLVTRIMANLESQEARISSVEK